MHAIDALNTAAKESTEWSYNADWLRDKLGIKRNDSLVAWGDRTLRFDAVAALRRIAEEMT